MFTLCQTWDIMPLNSPATLWGFYFYFPCERLREFNGIYHWVRGSAQIMVQTPTTSQDCLRPTMPNLNLSEGYMTQAHRTAERTFSCPVAWADYLVVTMMTFPLALLQLISMHNLFPGYWKNKTPSPSLFFPNMKRLPSQMVSHGAVSGGPNCFSCDLWTCTFV